MCTRNRHTNECVCRGREEEKNNLQKTATRKKKWKKHRRPLRTTFLCRVLIVFFSGLMDFGSGAHNIYIRVCVACMRALVYYIHMYVCACVYVYIIYIYTYGVYLVHRSPRW